jgi:hypothetical protein
MIAITAFSLRAFGCTMSSFYLLFLDHGTIRKFPPILTVVPFLEILILSCARILGHEMYVREQITNSGATMKLMKDGDVKK